MAELERRRKWKTNEPESCLGKRKGKEREAESVGKGKRRQVPPHQRHGVVPMQGHEELMEAARVHRKGSGCESSDRPEVKGR